MDPGPVLAGDDPTYVVLFRAVVDRAVELHNAANAG